MLCSSVILKQNEINVKRRCVLVDLSPSDLAVGCPVSRTFRWIAQEMKVRESKHQAGERQTKHWKMAARLSDKVSSADVNVLFTLIVFPQEKKNKGIPWYFVFFCLLLRLIRKIWANYPAEAAEEGGTRQLLLETVNSLWDQTPRGRCVLSWTSPFLELSWRVSLNETLNCLPKLPVTSTYENTVCFSFMLKFSFPE